MSEDLIGAAFVAVLMFRLFWPFWLFRLSGLIAHYHAATGAITEQRRDAEQRHSERILLRGARMPGQQHRKRRTHRRQRRHPRGFRQEDFGGLIDQEEEERKRKQLSANHL